MKTSRASSLGFGLVQIVIVAAIVLLVSGVGYRVYQATHRATPKNQSASSAPTIQSSNDLDKALQTLDKTSLDDSDSTELDHQADF